MSWLEKLKQNIITGLLGFVTVAVLSLFGAIPTIFLWNWLMPTITGMMTITFWQAWGINFLAGILFKNTVSMSI